MRISPALLSSVVGAASGVVVAREMIVGRLLRLRLAALCLMAGCGGSEVAPATPSPPPSSAETREPWSRFQEVKGFAEINQTPFATRGHLVKPSHAVVRVSPEASTAYLALVTDSVLPDGTVVAMFHQARDGSESGAVYVMEKSTGSWTFRALDSEGVPTADNLKVCALCHRGGVADHLFGLPRSLGSK